MALQPVPRYFRKAIQDFKGGLNTQDEALVIPGNQFPQLDDMLVNDTLLLQRAAGYTVTGSPFGADPSSFIRMLFNYRRGEATNILVAAASNPLNTNPTQKVDLKRTEDGVTFTDIGYTAGTATFSNGSQTVTGTNTLWLTALKAGDFIRATGGAFYAEISSVDSDTSLTLAFPYPNATAINSTYESRVILAQDAIPRAVVFNDDMIITNGSDAVLSYDSSNIGLISAAPRGKYIENHKNRVFIAATAVDPSNLYWSKVDDVTVWDGASVEPIFAQDNGVIVAIRSFGDSLIVLKNNGNIYQVNGSFDQDDIGEPAFIRRVDTPNNMGAIYGDTAVTHDDNRLYFWTDTGLYSLDSRMFVEKISWDIDRTVSGLTLKDTTPVIRTYTYDSYDEWSQRESNDGFRETGGGELELYNDNMLESCSRPFRQGTSAIHTDNTSYHLFYDAGSTLQVRQLKDVSGSVSNTLIGPGTAGTAAASIAVAPNGRVGLVYSVGATLSFREWNGTVWSAPVVVGVMGYSPTVLAIAYNNASYPTVAAVAVSSVLQTFRFDGIAWQAAVAPTPASIGAAQALICLAFNPNNGRMAVLFGHGSPCAVYESNDSGASWALKSTHTIVTAAATTFAQLAYDRTSNDLLIAFNDTSGGLDTIAVRNIDTAAVNTMVSQPVGSTLLLRGYFRFNSLDNIAYSDNSDSYLKFKMDSFPLLGTYTYGFPNFASSSLANGTNALMNNGRTIALFTYSSPPTVPEAYIFRVSFQGEWKSNDDSNSDHISWSTVDFIANALAGGATRTVELATGNIPNPTLFTARNTGTLIDPVDANIHVKAKITILRGNQLVFTLNTPNIQRLLLNYNAPGVSPIRPTSVVFDNELYTSVAVSPATNNNAIILCDKERVFSLQARPVSVMARFNGLLYAGSATNGDLLQLNNGFSANGAPIISTAVTKEDLLGSLELEKDIYKAYVLFKIQPAGTFTFSYRLDNFKNPAGNPWIPITVDQTTASTSPGLAEILIGQKARTIQFRIQCSELSQDIGIIGFVTLYGYLNVR